MGEYTTIYIGGIILLLIWILIWTKVSDKKEKILGIINSIIAGIIVYIFTSSLTSKLPPDYINLNRPYLEPELVITESDSAGFRYYYQITNVGALPAENIKFSSEDPRGKSAEFIPPVPRQLAPGGKMRYEAQMLKVIFKDKELFSKLVLVISYSYRIKESDKQSSDIFRIIIPNKDIQTGSRFYMEDAVRRDGAFTDEENYSFALSQIKLTKSTRFPGFSIHALISIKNTIERKEKYIFDAGYSNNKNRFSFFLDENNNILYRIIDSKSMNYFLKISNNNPQFRFSQPIYFNLEFGNRPDSTYMQIFINGQSIQKKEFNVRLEFPNIDSLLQNFIVGADINGNQCGNFNLGRLMIFDGVILETEKLDLQNYLATNKPKCYSFQGNAWVKRDKYSGNMLQENPLHRPIFKDHL